MDDIRQRQLTAVLDKLRTDQTAEFEGATLSLTDSGLIELAMRVKREDPRSLKNDFQTLLGPTMGGGTSSKDGEETMQVFYVWPKARLEEIYQNPKS